MKSRNHKKGQNTDATLVTTTQQEQQQHQQPPYETSVLHRVIS